FLKSGSDSGRLLGSFLESLLKYNAPEDFLKIFYYMVLIFHSFKAFERFWICRFFRSESNFGSLPERLP
ncbi:hypothetical protein IGI04_018702, partial [Brassica rapa subsp. trilocularis]